MPQSPPKIIAGRYEVLRELGRGGMGVVYLVQHVHTHEQAALKLLSAHVEQKPEAVERFRRETRAPALIKSEHVVKVMDADLAAELDGAPFYVMEYLVGCDVAHVLKQRGKLLPEEVVWILHQVARGLDKAHQLGIVHRDLKPENLFIHRREDGSCIVKIFDFGLVRFTQHVGGSSQDRALTNAQSMLGTPLYMAPEQATGGDSKQPIGPPADIWAIGMLGFELLTGKTYFGMDSLLQFVGQLLFAEIRPPSTKEPSLTPAFDDWFARACHRTQSERFPSVGAQVMALAQALGVDVASATATMPPGLRDALTPQENRPAEKVQSAQPDEPTQQFVDSSQQLVDPTQQVIEDPSIGAKRTLGINSDSPLRRPKTLGDVPTVFTPERSVGSIPTMSDQNVHTLSVSPTVIQTAKDLERALPTAPRRSLGAVWFTVGLALIGLLIFLIQSRSKPDSKTQQPQLVQDLAPAPPDEAKPIETPDLAAVTPDLAPKSETFVPIGKQPPAVPTKNLKLVRPPLGKKPLRPPLRPPGTPQAPQKPPEEYVHPTL